MSEFQGRFVRYKNGKPYAAIVKIKIKESLAQDIKINCNGDGWIAQGYLEYVSRDGYKNWKQGAIIGAKYALEKLEKPNLVIEITEIAGMITDTSPAAVGAATIYAVWEALTYIPSDEEKIHVENAVFSFDYDELPYF